MAATSVDAFEIALEGKADVYIPAERAVLKIVVSSTGADKQSAARDVVSTARKVEAIIMNLAPQQNTEQARSSASIDHWTRTSLVESSDRPYDNDTRKYGLLEYTATVDFEAQLQIFAALGGFITDMTALSNVKTQPVTWILQEETKDAHRSALRAQAAKNAYSKALEYAQALGYTNVVPRRLRETDIRENSSFRKGPPRRTEGISTAAKNLADVEGWEEIGGGVSEYQPEDIKISVAVQATFHAE